MPSRERREQEKVIKSDDFTQENKDDFAANAFATAQFAALQTKRNEIAAEQETKISAQGGARQNYEIAAEAEELLDNSINEVADFAGSMTDEFPALEEKFRKPRGSSRRNKIAVARTFAADAAEFKASFIERGLDADFIEKLTTRAAGLELALSKAVSETAKRVGASNKPKVLVLSNEFQIFFQNIYSYKNMKNFRLITLTIIFVLSLTAVQKSLATTFMVTNTNDNGAGSLRQSILEANVNSQHDTINFDPSVFNTPQVITLTGGDLFIRTDGGFGNTKSLTINGPGADKLTISGNNHSRIFRIELHGKAIINSLKISNGNGTDNGQIPDINGRGGGIFVEGGILFEDDSPNLLLTNSIVTNNQSIINNAAGGGILLFGKVTIINSAIINNVSISGGGISNPNGQLTVINSTISYNTASFTGGIQLQGGYLNLINSTIAFNHSTNTGNGGIYTGENPPITTLFYARNSIIARNTGISNFGNDISGPLKTGGNNIIGNTIGANIFPAVTNNLLNIDPQLDINLSNNGGVIPNHAVGAYSPGIDTGSNCVLTTTANGGCSDPNITTDIRGVIRPQDADGNGTATVDIGTFEVTRTEVLNAPSAAPDLQAANDTGTSNTDNITSATNLTFNVGGIASGAVIELLRDGGVVASTTAAGNQVVLSDSNVSGGVHVYTSKQTVGGVTSLQSAFLSVTVDTTAPTATVNQVGAQADPTNTQPINYTVTFSESVADFTVSDISFAGATANTSTANAVITGGDLNYNITVSNITADGTVVVSLPAGAVQDIAGNASAASVSTDNSVTLDTTAPTVTINQALTQADPTNSTPIRFTVVFSEIIGGFTGDDISLVGSTANVSSASKTITGSGTTYTVSISNISSNGGTVVASIPVNSVLDSAGNGSAASTSTDNTVTIDNIAPTVIINQASGQPDPTNLLPVSYTVVFSEPVTGFDSIADISFTGSIINTSGATITITGSGANYNVAVGGNIVSAGGILRTSVRSFAVTDAFGNSNLSSTSTDNSVTIDNVRPSVSINQAIGQADPTTNLPVNFTVVFSEIVSGFTAADVSLAGSTANVSNASINVSGSGTTYTVSIGNITSGGQITASISANAAQDALGNLSLASTSTDNTVTFTLRRSFVDFDGDGKTDISIFRPAQGEWWYLRSSDGGNRAFQFGNSADKIVPADFTGDGKTDVAVWRPASGEWFVLRSEDSSFYSFPFGTSGDTPVVGDFDADGKADAGVFRPSTLTWFISKSSGGTIIQQFGAAGDKPVPADYDGDGKTDIAIFRANGANGAEWWIQRSSNNSVFAAGFGNATDKPTQGDFTGDGKADIAVWRPSNGNWFVLRSEDFSFFAFPFGTTNDVPVAGDYDGDGKFDAGVFRPSSNTWFIQRSTAGTLIQQFGIAGDLPLPNAFVP